MHLDRHGNTIHELVALAAKIELTEARFVEAVSQRRCGLEIPRGSGEASTFVDPCGRAATTFCSDCRTPICAEHCEIQPIEGEFAVLCPVCSSFVKGMRL